MAYSSSRQFHAQKIPTESGQDENFETPYNSVSSFKGDIDNTVVSAYDVDVSLYDKLKPRSVRRSKPPVPPRRSLKLKSQSLTDLRTVASVDGQPNNDKVDTEATIKGTNKTDKTINKPLTKPKKPPKPDRFKADIDRRKQTCASEGDERNYLGGASVLQAKINLDDQNQDQKRHSTSDYLQKDTKPAGNASVLLNNNALKGSQIIPTDRKSSRTEKGIRTHRTDKESSVVKQREDGRPVYQPPAIRHYANKLTKTERPKSAIDRAEKLERHKHEVESCEKPRSKSDSGVRFVKRQSSYHRRQASSDSNGKILPSSRHSDHPESEHAAISPCQHSLSSRRKLPKVPGIPNIPRRRSSTNYVHVLEIARCKSTNSMGTIDDKGDDAGVSLSLPVEQLDIDIGDVQMDDSPGGAERMLQATQGKHKGVSSSSPGVNVSLQKDNSKSSMNNDKHKDIGETSRCNKGDICDKGFGNPTNKDICDITNKHVSAQKCADGLLDTHHVKPSDNLHDVGNVRATKATFVECGNGVNVLKENVDKHSGRISKSETNHPNAGYEPVTIEGALNNIVDNAAHVLEKGASQGVIFNFNKDIIHEFTEDVVDTNHVSEKRQDNVTEESSDPLKKCLSDENQIRERFLDQLKKSLRDVNSSRKNEKSKIDIEGKSYNGKVSNNDSVLEDKGKVPSVDPLRKDITSANAEADNSKTEELTTVQCAKLECNMDDSATKSVEVVEKCQNDISEGDAGTNSENPSGQSKPNIARTPSYRRRVMARAKTRYSKKSKHYKECSCVRNENGDIETCPFCEKYETFKRRSQSSLGNVTVDKEYAEFSDGEIPLPRRAFTPGMASSPVPSIGVSRTDSPIGNQVSNRTGSPRNLTKVHVSNRVDVLMSSNLFRKHLEKHAHLLHTPEKASKKYGMRRSISNLDLTQGLSILEGLDQDLKLECNGEDADFTDDYDTSEVTSECSRGEISARLQDFESPNRHSRQTCSLTADSDSSAESYQENSVPHKVRTLPKSFHNQRSRPSILDHNTYKPHCKIPSFDEFRQRKSSLKSDTSGSRSKSKARGRKVGDSNSQDNVTGDLGDSSCLNARVSSPMIMLDLHTINESDAKDSKENLADDIPRNDNINTYANKYVKDDSSHNKTDRLHQKHALRHSDVPKSVSPQPPMLLQANAANAQRPHKPKSRPKLKSRAISLLELESDNMSWSDNSENSQEHTSLREKRRKEAKRPRSLISKKSSLASLIQESNSQNSPESVRSQNIADRPKLKVGRAAARSNSDSNLRDRRGDKRTENESGDPREIDSPRSRAEDRGVNFDLGDDVMDDFSQCSTQDLGESESSTSAGGSFLSDSLHSEIIVDETSRVLADLDDIESETNERLKDLKDDLMTSVLRSTSDACEITPEAARKRRERKERPYKSDPFSGTEIIPASKRCVLREERARLRQHTSFASSSKEQILKILDDISHSQLASGESFPSLEELNEDDEQNVSVSDVNSESSRHKHRKHLSNVSSLSTDSGVIGQDGSHDSQQSSPSNTLHRVSSASSLRPSVSSASSSQYHAGSPSESMPGVSSPSNTRYRTSCPADALHRVQSDAHGQLQRRGLRSLSASCSDLSPRRECYDCVGPDQYHLRTAIYICTQCIHKRIERKKTIQEIVDTELNYGRDLTIMKEEFYIPMMKAGLLNQDQLDSIFLNLDELIHINTHFITKLQASINTSNHTDDDDLNGVMIGSLFLESSTMFLTFENYCVNQAQSPVILEQMEREKELLRIFLHVSQNENHLLRRMHLKSFLMVPVQRIMKYPLLLDRLYKATPSHHNDKDAIKEAKEKIEDILGHINAKSRPTSIRQRKTSEKRFSVTEKMEVSRIALETLRWNRKYACDVITSRLQISQPLDHMWAAKKCKNYKFTTVHAVLFSLTQPSNQSELDQSPRLNSSSSSNNNNNSNINNNNNNGSSSSSSNNNMSGCVQHAAMVLIREKNGKFQLHRDPFMLDKCVVSQDPDFTEVFELLEWNKESFLIKADTPNETKLWVQNLRQQMHNLGMWRKRRNALPNILLNHFG